MLGDFFDSPPKHPITSGLLLFSTSKVLPLPDTASAPRRTSLPGMGRAQQTMFLLLSEEDTVLLLVLAGPNLMWNLG